MAYGQFAFGVREVKVYNADGSGGLAFPAALLLHVTPRIATSEFLVEGLVVRVRSFIVACDWEVEAGSLDLNVYGKLTGQNVGTGGSAPNRQTSMTLFGGYDFPTVRIYGRAVDDQGGDIVCKMYSCKLTGIEGSFRNNQFHILSASGVSVADSSLGCCDLLQRETNIVL